MHDLLAATKAELDAAMVERDAARSTLAERGATVLQQTEDLEKANEELAKLPLQSD